MVFPSSSSPSPSPSPLLLLFLLCCCCRCDYGSNAFLLLSGSSGGNLLRSSSSNNRWQQQQETTLLAVLNNDNNNNDGADSTADTKMEWQDLDGGCKLLTPSPTATTTTTTAPKAIIHFLGGAFVSPQPTVAYRYVLEQLSHRGYAIIATPFAVDFDYRKSVAEISHKFSRACRELETETAAARKAETEADSDKVKMVDFPSLPLLAMGHSFGALMQVLLACEFNNNNNNNPDDDDDVDEHHTDHRPVVGTVLISYNNKNVDSAIPAFKEVFVPALQPLEPLTRDPQLTEALLRVQEVRRKGFESLRTTTQGMQTALGLQDNESLLPGVRPLALKAINDVEAASELVDQIPGVLASIAQGASESEPTPEEIRSIVTETYHQEAEALPPLIVKFREDVIDESDELAAILPESLGAQRVTLSGTHVTPLAIDPNADSTPLLSIPETLATGLTGDVRQELLRNADALVDTLDEYFLEAIERTTTITTTTTMTTKTATTEEEKVITDSTNSVVLDPSMTTPTPTTDAVDEDAVDDIVDEIVDEIVDDIVDEIVDTISTTDSASVEENENTNTNANKNSGNMTKTDDDSIK